MYNLRGIDGVRLQNKVNPFTKKKLKKKPPNRVVFFTDIRILSCNNSFYAINAYNRTFTFRKTLL